MNGVRARRVPLGLLRLDSFVLHFQSRKPIMEIEAYPRAETRERWGLFKARLLEAPKLLSNRGLGPRLRLRV